MSGDNTIRVTTINGAKFVSGLYWQPLTRPRAYMKEAREIGKQKGMDIVAIRRSETVIQGGFVSKADGAYKGMYSLAAALAGQLGDTWLGAFSLPDGQYALVGILRGGVIPGSDIIGDLETISEALRAVYGYKHGIDDSNVYAPEEMNFGGQSLEIEKLLAPGNLRKEYSLKPLTFTLTKQQVFTIAALALAVIVGTTGYWRYEVAQEKKRRDAEVMAAKIKLAEIEAMNARSRAEQTAKSIVHPWSVQPTVRDFLDDCKVQIDKLELASAGWTLESMVCDGHRFIANYKRTNNATVLDFVNFSIRAGYGDNPALYGEGEGASVSVETKLVLAGEEPLLLQDSVLKAFTSHFQSIGVKTKITPVEITIPTPPLLPGQDPAQVPPAPVPDWKQSQFEINTQLPPEFVLDGLDTTGIRLTEISNTVKDAQLNWTIKGQIYAK
jgi:hypothetical protein